MPSGLQDKFILTATEDAPEQRNATQSSGAARVLTYGRLPHSPRLATGRWQAVRVAAPVLSPERWLERWGQQVLCCGRATERPHRNEIDVTLHECPLPPGPVASA